MPIYRIRITYLDTIKADNLDEVIEKALQSIEFYPFLYDSFEIEDVKED